MEILILEDDSALRFALAQALEDEGYAVRPAASIQEAVKILESANIGLLLLDLVIGKNRSTQIADLAGYRLPLAEVIYVTGSAEFPNGELFTISKNASWVLRKPVDFVELKILVGHIAKSFATKKIISSSLFQHLEPQT